MKTSYILQLFLQCLFEKLLQNQETWPQQSQERARTAEGTNKSIKGFYLDRSNN